MDSFKAETATVQGLVPGMAGFPTELTFIVPWFGPIASGLRYSLEVSKAYIMNEC